MYSQDDDNNSHDRSKIPDKIVLNAEGKFPLDLILMKNGEANRYRLVKTKSDGLVLNK